MGDQKSGIRFLTAHLVVGWREGALARVSVGRAVRGRGRVWVRLRLYLRPFPLPFADPT